MFETAFNPSGWPQWMAIKLDQLGLSEVLGLDSQFMIAVIASLVFGLLIGSERSYNGRAAGMRTYALVSLTSTILCAASVHPEVLMLASTPTGIDPTRTVQGVMTGIGFLGGGLIAKEGFNIKGLTSAASIWGAAGIGVLCGLHLVGEAGFVTVLFLIILIGLRTVEPMIPHRTYADLTLGFAAMGEIEHETVKSWIERFGFVEVQTTFSREKQHYVLKMTLRGGKTSSLEELSKFIRRNPDIRTFELAPRKD